MLQWLVNICVAFAQREEASRKIFKGVLEGVLFFVVLVVLLYFYPNLNCFLTASGVKSVAIIFLCYVDVLCRCSCSAVSDSW